MLFYDFNFINVYMEFIANLYGALNDDISKPRKHPREQSIFLCSFLWDMATWVDCRTCSVYIVLPICASQYMARLCQFFWSVKYTGSMQLITVRLSKFYLLTCWLLVGSNCYHVSPTNKLLGKLPQIGCLSWLQLSLFRFLDPSALWIIWLWHSYLESVR